MSATKGVSSSLRERILGSAGELFYRDGIRAVGVDTIVAVAGTAKMTLYKYFKSKDDLVLAWLRRRDEEWRRDFETSVERRAKAPRERLLAIYDVLEEWFERPGFRGCAFVNICAETSEPDHPCRRVVLEHKRLVTEYVARLARAAGLAEPERLAAALVLLIDGACVGAVIRNTAAPAGEARRIAALLIKESKPKA